MHNPKSQQPTIDELCQRMLLEAHAVRRVLAVGTKLFPDRDADSLQLVVEGAIAIQYHRRNGGTMTLEVAGVGDCLPSGDRVSPVGEGMIFSALVPTTIARVPQSTFASLVRKTPSLANAFGAMLSGQHLELLARLAALSVRAPSGRLADALLYLAQKLGQPCPFAPGTRLPLSQSVLAEVADVSRQTTNRVLRQLQSSGLVRIERSAVCLLDREGLEAFTTGRPLVRVWKAAGSCKLAHPEEPLTCYPLRLAPRR
jgi:CRP/FNR family cyclic AMP-dependent transcriptional regulator